MPESKNLILGKAKFSDWEDMYYGVWSREECARYMLWDLTATAEDAKARMQRTIDFQKDHDAFLVYEKKSGRAIGFIGVTELAPGLFEETGICLSPDCQGKGYGKEIMHWLVDFCRERGGKELRYTARVENIPSNGLARSLGFEEYERVDKTDPRNGQNYRQINYRLDL